VVFEEIAMIKTYQVFPVGMVDKNKNRTAIEIYEEYTAALLGLDSFSHIVVLYWFHHNDTPAKRRFLQVHPRKNDKNPLTGVFGTHSPVRPNPIALSICKIQAIQSSRIIIEAIDAVNGSPVIDIKAYIPDKKARSDIKLPDWV
jgi:tRNA-Thr(GGU) m(6)t(6)A37 methyltransferase TsaA